MIDDKDKIKELNAQIKELIDQVEELKASESALNEEVTSLRQTANALKNSDDLYKTFLENLPVCCSRHNRKTGKHVYWNQNGFTHSLTELFEKSKDEKFEILHPDDLKSVLSTYEEWIKQNDNNRLSIEYRIKDKNGLYLWIECHLYKEFSKGGEWSYIDELSWDITERKMAESGLILAKELAEAANRKKSDFLAKLSHDIKTPMNAVLGFAELLQNIVNDERQSEFVDAILSSGQDLLRIINEMPDLSSIETDIMTLNLTPVDPSVLFEDVVKIFKYEAQSKEIDLIYNSDNDIPERLQLDEIKLRNVIESIIGNAIKFTEKGLIKIALSCRFNPNEDNKVDLICKVTDTGIGIAKEKLDKILETFSQFKSNILSPQTVTGHGLILSNRLVETMGGKFSISSSPGRGSVITIAICDVETSYPMKRNTDLTKNKDRSYDFKGFTILVVEDIQLNRKLIKAMLEFTGIQIVEAINGADAITILENLRPDIILMDMMMPVMNGIEATTKIKSNIEFRNIPIVSLTAGVLDEQHEKARIAGCDAFINKPIDVDELLETLQKLLNVKPTFDN